MDKMKFHQLAYAVLFFLQIAELIVYSIIIYMQNFVPDDVYTIEDDYRDFISVASLITFLDGVVLNALYFQ